LPEAADVTNVQRTSRRGARRIELSFPLTASTDIAFGISLRVPRRRPRQRGELRRWSAAVMTAGLYVLAAVAPIATVAAGPELARLAALVRPTPPAVVYAAVDDPARPLVRARGSLLTTFSDDPPALRTHVVAPEETLLSIAARYGIAPQTLAYDNSIADTSQLRVGQSLIVPPFDAAIHVVQEGETLASIAASYGVGLDAIHAADRSTFEAADDTPGRTLIVSVPDARYPGFRLRVSDAPRVIAPRVRWPTEGVITQLFSPGHQGVDIAAPFGSPIVATDAGTVSAVGYRGPGGLAVCVYHDWGLETCAYHTSAVTVEVGERVVAGQRIALIGLTGVTTGPHVHWEARTNGVLVDPMTYAPSTTAIIRVGGATGSP
jgi:murein DD-endopeptidase MepM/ murein hydrolase activator NlpD